MCEPCDRMRVGLPSAPTASVIGPASVVTSTSRSGPSVLTARDLRVGGQRHAQQPQRMVELLGAAVGGHRGGGACRRAVGADVVGDVAVHALDLRLRLRPLEVGEVRRPRLRRAHPRPVDLNLALEGADREGLAGQPGPQILAEVVLRCRCRPSSVRRPPRCAPARPAPRRHRRPAAARACGACRPPRRSRRGRARRTADR